jgi:HSP20 family molecular chaperone IbpA
MHRVYAVTEKQSVNMTKIQMKVAPDTVAYANAETHKLVVEFAIPGAPSDSIDLKILEDSVHLTAPARDIEYVAALALGWPVKPDKAEASYENGLLRIEVPFKDPMEDAVKVAIKTSGGETKAKTITTGGEVPGARVAGKAPAAQQPKSPVAAPA